MQDKINKLQELISTFHSNIKQYKSSAYDEANTRVDFIDKFFELLEWDVRNTQGYSEDFREVVREDTVYIAGKPKAPDYSFRQGGRRLFFVEAKKPSVDIKEALEPAFQLRRYAYTAKLPLSILTDFEEFAVYDTRIKPNDKDKASVARIFYCKYDEYLSPTKTDHGKTNFEYIQSIFSKGDILKGSFKNFIDDTKRKSGTSEVDKEFLKLIETWRTDLAKTIALRNKDIDVYNLNTAIQKIIDRIIFIRIAEDRHMEEYGALLAISKEKNVYQKLDEFFQKADAKYNSGLFLIFDWISKLIIDDKVLSGIIQELYPPGCPYEFSVLPIEILGNIYEQFLGKTIRLTPAHQAKVEEKPEVRKAGGVYYTPQYIVDYIVENTVGEMLRKAKQPQKIEKIKILDPACGSGSFLVGAFSYLLNYHIEYFSQAKNVKKAMKEGKIYQFSENTFRLSIKEKQRILLNNIYGVDIDYQAVEVTKLSLLLKLMENEQVESSGELFKHSDLKLLPNLSDNIRCGNSLIGSDFYEEKELSLFGKEEMRKVNAFDWDKEFEEVFEAGGFDCVIGNPPYIRIQTMKEWTPESVEHFNNIYHSTKKGNYDVYVIFVEKGLKLLNSKGKLGFILPHKFMNSIYGRPLREYISKNNHLNKIVHFGDNQIFSGATTYTCLLFLNKTSQKQFIFEKVLDIDGWISKINPILEKYPNSKVTENEWNFIVGKGANLFNRLSDFQIKLGEIADIFQGLVTGADKIYVLNIISNSENGFFQVKDTNEKIWNLESDICKPFLSKVTVETYIEPLQSHILIFPYKIVNNKAVLFSPQEIKTNYPNTWEYLVSNKKILQDREGGKWHHEKWYAFGRSQNLNQMKLPKLIVQVISLYGRYATDSNMIHFTGGGNGPYYGIRWKKNYISHPLTYLQALLSSKLLDFYLFNISTTFRGGYWSYGKRYLEQLPICLLNLSNPSEKAQHDKMLSLADQMLSTKKEFQSAKSESDKEIIQKKIDLLDRQIDALVYELYGLTDEEIRIVEGG